MRARSDTLVGNCTCCKLGNLISGFVSSGGNDPYCIVNTFIVNEAAYQIEAVWGIMIEWTTEGIAGPGLPALHR